MGYVVMSAAEFDQFEEDWLSEQTYYANCGSLDLDVPYEVIEARWIAEGL